MPCYGNRPQNSQIAEGSVKNKTEKGQEIDRFNSSIGLRGSNILMAFSFQWKLILKSLPLKLGR